jgi:hypothetical protein
MWARLPRVFAFAIVLAAASELWPVCQPPDSYAGFWALSITMVVTQVVLGIGMFALARRSSPLAGPGVKVAALVHFGLALGAALSLGDLFNFASWVDFAASLVLVISIAMALSPARRGELWLCIALAILTRLPPFADELLWQCLRAFLPGSLVLLCGVLFVLAYWTCIAALASAIVVERGLPKARLVRHD